MSSLPKCAVRRRMKLLVVNIDTQRVGTGTIVGTLMNSSEELISRARSGDEEAFRFIFERYARLVVSLSTEWSARLIWLRS